jgi:hypothetical protein
MGKAVSPSSQLNACHVLMQHPLGVSVCAVDTQVDTGHGGCHAWRDQGHGGHEQADEPAGPVKDHARIREAERAHGDDVRNDGRRDRRRHGGVGSLRPYFCLSI